MLWILCSVWVSGGHQKQTVWKNWTMREYVAQDDMRNSKNIGIQKAGFNAIFNNKWNVHVSQMKLGATCIYMHINICAAVSSMQTCAIWKYVQCSSYYVSHKLMTKISFSSVLTLRILPVCTGNVNTRQWYNATFHLLFQNEKTTGNALPKKDARTKQILHHCTQQKHVYMPRISVRCWRF